MRRNSATFIGSCTLAILAIWLGSAEPVHAQSADLSVSLQGTQLAQPSDTVTYTVTIANAGAQTATGVEVIFSLDKDIKFRDASDNGRERSRNITWENLEIPANGNTALTVIGEVGNKVQDDDLLKNTAILGGIVQEIQTRIENEEDSNNDDIRDITLTLTPSVSEAEPDETLNYSVTLTNNGAKVIRDMEITLELDADIEALSASNKGEIKDSVITWKDIDVGASQSRNLTVTLRIADEARPKSTLESIVYSEGSIAKNSITIKERQQQAKRISVHAFTEQDSVQPGEAIEYTIRVRNDDKDDERIDVFAYLDFRTQFLSANEGGEQIERHVIEWRDLFLEQNDTKNLILSIEAKEDSTRGGDTLRLIIDSGSQQRHVITPVLADASDVAVDFVVNDTQETDAPTASNNVPVPTRVVPQRPVASPTFASFVIDPQGIIAQASAQEVAQPKTVASTPVQSNTAAPIVAAAASSEKEEIKEEVQEPEPQQNIAVTLHTDKSEAQPGSMIFYTISVVNTHTSAIDNAMVTYAFPASVLRIEDLPGTLMTEEGIHWNIMQLAPGSTWEKKFRAMVSPEIPHGTELKTSIEIESIDGEILGSQHNTTNVIGKLPQAGFGTFIAAVEASNGLLRDPVEKTTLSAQSDTSKTATTVLIAMISMLCIAIGIRWAVAYAKN